MLGSSNATIASVSPGGVARNVASNLGRLGLQVQLVTRVGKDSAGADLLEQTARHGVDVTLSEATDAAATGSYTAVLQPGGELLIGLSEMEACEGLSWPFLAERWDRIAASTLLFADANLPAETLAALLRAVRERGCRLALDAVSEAKVERLPQDLAGVEMLFCNVEEARVLTGNGGGGAGELAGALCQRGAELAFVSEGPEGLACRSGEGGLRLPAEQATVADVSGAGDALVAGVIFARLQGWDLESACRAGLRAARLTVESLGSGSRVLGPQVLPAAPGPKAAP